MRKIYVDAKSRCHVTGDDTMIAVETDFFDGKCDAYVEGFCYIAGETTRIFAYRPYDVLDAAQRAYEQALIADMQNALLRLGVTLDG